MRGSRKPRKIDVIREQSKTIEEMQDIIFKQDAVIRNLQAYIQEITKEKQIDL